MDRGKRIRRGVIILVTGGVLALVVGLNLRRAILQADADQNLIRSVMEGDLVAVNLWLDDGASPDAVIGELKMSPGHFDFWHVAGNA